MSNSMRIFEDAVYAINRLQNPRDSDQYKYLSSVCRAITDLQQSVFDIREKVAFTPPGGWSQDPRPRLLTIQRIMQGLRIRNYELGFDSSLGIIKVTFNNPDEAANIEALQTATQEIVLNKATVVDGRTLTIDAGVVDPAYLTAMSEGIYRPSNLKGRPPKLETLILVQKTELPSGYHIIVQKSHNTDVSDPTVMLMGPQHGGWVQITDEGSFLEDTLKDWEKYALRNSMTRWQWAKTLPPSVMFLIKNNRGYYDGLLSRIAPEDWSYFDKFTRDKREVSDLLRDLFQRIENDREWAHAFGKKTWEEKREEEAEEYKRRSAENRAKGLRDSWMEFSSPSLRSRVDILAKSLGTPVKSPGFTGDGSFIIRSGLSPDLDAALEGKREIPSARVQQFFDKVAGIADQVDVIWLGASKKVGSSAGGAAGGVVGRLGDAGPVFGLPIPQWSFIRKMGWRVKAGKNIAPKDPLGIYSGETLVGVASRILEIPEPPVLPGWGIKLGTKEAPINPVAAPAPGDTPTKGRGPLRMEDKGHVKITPEKIEKGYQGPLTLGQTASLTSLAQFRKAVGSNMCAGPRYVGSGRLLVRAEISAPLAGIDAASSVLDDVVDRVFKSEPMETVSWVAAEITYANTPVVYGMAGSTLIAMDAVFWNFARTQGLQIVAQAREAALMRGSEIMGKVSLLKNPVLPETRWPTPITL